MLVYGKDLDTKTRRFEIHQDYRFKQPVTEGGSDLTLKGSTRIDAPFVPFDLSVAGDYAQNKGSFDVSASLLKNRVGAKVAAKLNTKAAGDYDVEATASLNKHTAKLDVSREIKGDHSKFEHELTLSCGAKAELVVEFDHEPTPQNADIKVDGSVRLAEKEDPYK